MFQKTKTERLKRDMKGFKTVTGKDLESLLEKQCYRCAYSGVELTPDNASLDHKIPISKGGSHDIENLAIVRADINAAKGSLTLDEFIDLCRIVTKNADSMANASQS